PLQRAIRDRAAAAPGFEAKRPARPTRLRRVIGDGIPGGVADDEAGELPPAARGAVFDNPKPGVRPGSLPRRGIDSETRLMEWAQHGRSWRPPMVARPLCCQSHQADLQLPLALLNRQRSRL